MFCWFVAYFGCLFVVLLGGFAVDFIVGLLLNLRFLIAVCALLCVYLSCLILVYSCLLLWFLRLCYTCLVGFAFNLLWGLWFSGVGFDTCTWLVLRFDGLLVYCGHVMYWI